MFPLTRSKVQSAVKMMGRLQGLFGGTFWVKYFIVISNQHKLIKSKFVKIRKIERNREEISCHHPAPGSWAKYPIPEHRCLFYFYAAGTLF